MGHRDPHTLLVRTYPLWVEHKYVLLSEITIAHYAMATSTHT